jgi:hypothetical protein
LRQYPGDEVIYASADYFEPGDAETEGDAETYPPEFLHQLDPNGFSVHQLALKVGAPVHRSIVVKVSTHKKYEPPPVVLLGLICIRNLSRKTGLMNGTRGIITELHKHSVVICPSSGPMAGENIVIPRINLQSSGQFKTQCQFPF